MELFQKKNNDMFSCAVFQLHADMYRLPDRRCQVCGKQFYTEEKHIRHMNRFHPDLWAEFSGGRPLEFFIPPREVQHREKKFVCSICSKTYSHETGLLKHLVTHPESHELRTRLWTCPVCDKVFTKESYLERHLEMKLDPEHNKALTDYKKRNGIRDVGRVNLAVHHTNGGVSNMVTSSDSGAISAGSSVELLSTSAQLMPASSSARTTDGMGSPPHTTTPSHTPSSFSHHSDLPPHPMPPRSPMVVHPTPSCSLAAADSTVPSPFSSSPHSQRSPTLSRPLSHPSPLLNRSYSESCLSSGHPLFGPGMGQPHSAMDAMTHALHGPMSPPPQGCHPHSFRAHLGGYNPPTSQHYGGAMVGNPGGNLPPLRFSHLPSLRRDLAARPGDHEDVVSALQSLADSIHPS